MGVKVGVRVGVRVGVARPACSNSFTLMSLITYTHILTETHSHLLALTLTHSLSMYPAQVNEIRMFIGLRPRDSQ